MLVPMCWSATRRLASSPCGGGPSPGLRSVRRLPRTRSGGRLVGFTAWPSSRSAYSVCRAA